MPSTRRAFDPAAAAAAVVVVVVALHDLFCETSAECRSRVARNGDLCLDNVRTDSGIACADGIASSIVNARQLTVDLFFSFIFGSPGGARIRSTGCCIVGANADNDRLCVQRRSPIRVL
jgi:hypothetical protein